MRLRWKLVPLCLGSAHRQNGTNRTGHQVANKKRIHPPCTCTPSWEWTRAMTEFPKFLGWQLIGISYITFYLNGLHLKNFQFIYLWFLICSVKGVRYGESLSFSTMFLIFSSPLLNACFVSTNAKTQASKSSLSRKTGLTEINSKSLGYSAYSASLYLWESPRSVTWVEWKSISL